MDAVDVVKALGSAAPWLITAIVLFLAMILATAFRQGRSIQIWPPQIGARPERSIAAPEPAPQTTPGVDREYGVDRARDFYGEIARNYDLRNSGNLVSTHLATVAELQSIRRGLSGMRVLDLGGGTGKLIAVHFFNDVDVSWTYVDFCPEMAAELRRNLAGHPLSRHMKIIVDDIDSALAELPSASYDVIMLSLVLSSMPALPNFDAIARVLAPGGSLIVTDISPSYTFAKPLYRVPIGSDQVALRTRSIDPYEVIRRAKIVGLGVTNNLPLGDGNTYYSFLTTFTPVHQKIHDGPIVVPTAAG